MDHSALWWHVCQDFRDVGSNAPHNFCRLRLLDVPQQRPTKQDLGLQAALRLLAQCKCSDCDLRKVNSSAVTQVAATPLTTPTQRVLAGSEQLDAACRVVTPGSA